MVCRRSKDPLLGLDHSFPPEAQDHPIIYANGSKDAVKIGSDLALVTTISNAANVTLRFPDYFHEELEQPSAPFTLGSAPNIVIDKEVMLKYSFFTRSKAYVSLFTSFFDKIHGWFPLWHRVSWIQRYINTFDGPVVFDSKRCMVLMVLALGSMAQHDQLGTSNRRGSDYAQAAFAMLPAVMTGIDLASVHSLILVRCVNLHLGHAHV
jgi:hypothetical protein